MLLDADGSRRKRVLIKVGPKLFGLLDERREASALRPYADAATTPIAAAATSLSRRFVRFMTPLPT